MKPLEKRRRRWISYVRAPVPAGDGVDPVRFFSALEDYTPWVEYRRGYEAYLDLGGVRRLWGHPLPIIDRLQEKLARMGVAASFGLGSNKLLARAAASLAGEREVFWVLPQGERDFLEGLPVELWPELEKRIIPQLRLLGVRRVGDLSRVDAFWVRRVWGERGLLLGQQSRGFDPRPVVRKLPPPPGGLPLVQPGFFPPRGKKEKLSILSRLASFFRQKYGGGVVQFRPSTKSE